MPKAYTMLPRCLIYDKQPHEQFSLHMLPYQKCRRRIDYSALVIYTSVRCRCCYCHYNLFWRCVTTGFEIWCCAGFISRAWFLLIIDFFKEERHAIAHDFTKRILSYKIEMGLLTFDMRAFISLLHLHALSLRLIITTIYFLSLLRFHSFLIHATLRHIDTSFHATPLSLHYSPAFQLSPHCRRFLSFSPIAAFLLLLMLSSYIYICVSFRTPLFD